MQCKTACSQVLQDLSHVHLFARVESQLQQGQNSFNLRGGEAKGVPLNIESQDIHLTHIPLNYDYLTFTMSRLFKCYLRATITKTTSQYVLRIKDRKTQKSKCSNVKHCYYLHDLWFDISVEKKQVIQEKRVKRIKLQHKLQRSPCRYMSLKMLREEF